MTTRSRLVTVLRYALAVIVIGAVGWALVRNWSAVRADLLRMSPVAVVASLVLAVVTPVPVMLGWRALLAGLGSPLPVTPAASIFFIGQLGKYVPGSLWAVLAQAEMAARYRVPRRRTAVVGLLSLGLATVTGGIVALPALPLLFLRDGATDIPWWSPVVAIPFLALLCWPRFLNAAVALLLRVLHRAPLDHRLSGRVILVAVGWMLVAWVCAGAAALVLVADLADTPPSAWAPLLVPSIGGYALAAVIGMFAVFAPAGVGVRDALLVVVLAGVVSVPAGAAVAVLTRFGTTIADITVAAAAGVWGRRAAAREAARNKADREVVEP